MIKYIANEGWWHEKYNIMSEDRVDAWYKKYWQSFDTAKENEEEEVLF